MAISKEEVLHIAHLSRLSLSDEEAELFAGQLSKTLEYSAQLSGLDTENIEPTFHAVPNENVFREDTPGKVLSPEAALKNTACSKETFFEVPKVADG